ncbi:carboxypeptidase-like regulatory domain-containing protein [Blastopirellula marina]|nr:carboxypeptidase-like regulatory domain-containing protein [Blastopirellula marina]
MIALTSFLVGCGGPTGDMGTVTGTVTLDGAPLPGVMVTFTPADGERESFGVTNSSGVYKLRYTTQIMGAKKGEHQVRISPVGVEPTVPVSKKAAVVPKGDDGDSAEKATSVPKHYYGEDYLTREVQAGSNTIDLELTATPTASDS